MKEMICQHCGAGLKWDGISRTVKCGFCGAEYLMHPKEERGGQLPAYGDGTVVPMTIYGDAFIQDRPFIKSYVPVGWRIMTGQADRIDMMGNPIVPEIRLTAPDESDFIFFRGLSSYKHIEPNAMNARLQGQLDFGPINLMNPSYFRLKSFMPAEECLDVLIRENCRIQNMQTVSEQTADEKEKERQQRIIELGRRAGFSEVWPEWLRRVSRGMLPNGTPVMAVAETRVVLNIRGQTPQGMQNPGMQAGSLLGGFMGGLLNKMGAFAGNSSELRIWETQYELFGISPEKDFEKLLEEFEKVDQTVDYLPVMQQIVGQMNAFIENEKMKTQNTIANAQFNMAQEGNYFQPGVDFTELKRTKGDY